MRKRRLLPLLMSVILLLFGAGTAGAWDLDHGYAGTYPDQYSVDSGTFSTGYDGGNNTFGAAAQFHWRSSAVGWIQSNAAYSGSFHNKPAIAFHGEAAPGNPCVSLDASTWFSSDLPNARGQWEFHCTSAYYEEVRVLADAPWQLGGYANYYAQVMYNNVGTGGGDLNVSSYWLDWYDHPSGTGGAPNSGRDYNTKNCFGWVSGGIGWSYC